MQNLALLQFLRLLGKLRGLGESDLINSLDPRSIVKKLVENTFKDDSVHNVDLLKRCITIFKFDRIELLLEYIKSHKMNFLKSFSDIFEFKYSVNLIELEKFFETI